MLLKCLQRGDNHLGGDDFDARLVNYLVERFKETDGINLSKDASAMQRLRDRLRKPRKNCRLHLMPILISHLLRWLKMDHIIWI